MNLTETLNLALPELPASRGQARQFRLHPKIVARERIEGGQPIVSCVVSGKSSLFRFPPFQWTLLQLFDGVRSYEEIAHAYFEQTGTRFSVEELRSMAEALDQSGFWYRTTMLDNTSLAQSQSRERHQRNDRKSKYGDVSHLQFSAWDPDSYLDWVHARLSFVYSRWFTLLSIVSFVFMTYVFVTRWGEIGQDTLQFYNLTRKSFSDVVEFWVLAAFVLFFHETGHGLTCKHYGGHVHRMGFHLVYFTPAFFTDVTEAWVYGGKKERLATIIAGAWTETLICAVATPLWWGTPYGTWLHNVAYNLILITGVGVIFFNYNPLIKLDGYYFLTELIEIPDLKEESTAYLAALLKKHFWRLPIDVPYVPKRRRPWYIIYAGVSGIYSYSLLAFFARFVGNVFRDFSPTWAFIPAWLVGLRLFKSRIQTLVKFMKTVYLDKKDHLNAWLTLPRRIASGVALALVLVFPWARESVQGRFVLEPVQMAVLRASVPGTIVSVSVEEGQHLAAGAKVATLGNWQIESAAQETRAALIAATARSVQAQLRYSDFAPGENERQRLMRDSTLLQQQVEGLSITTPISGIVLTPRLSERIGTFVPAGTMLAEVGSIDQMRARIYVPDFELRKVAVGASATLHFDSFFRSRKAVVLSSAPASSEMLPGLQREAPYKGLHSPSFYIATVVLDNPAHQLLPGMTGTAHIYVGRRSLAAIGWSAVREFIQRKIW